MKQALQLIQLKQLIQLQQIRFNESLSCRGEGGCAGKGGPLWSPAVSLNDDAYRNIAIDKGVKYANTD